MSAASAASAILRELRARGAVAYRRGDEVRMRPARAITPDLLTRVKRYKAELLPLLPNWPSGTAGVAATVPAPPNEQPWVVSSASSGNMRLVVAAHPRDWPGRVYRAAALLEILDARTLADRADAQKLADELERILAVLRAEGIGAWITS